MDFAVVQGVRTKEQQAELYAQGRTKPGQIVTWTMESNHLLQEDDTGHAIDIVPVINGKMDWDTLENFTFLAALMFRAAMEERVQISWGGFWKTPDRPHFELKGK
jgi:peptidoglycan L-alanyl-D-glutamate endopeptidase CwlK